MILPTSYQELERIYQTLTLQSSSCVAVSSAEPGEGVSLLVDALARRAASVQKKVLIVDFNLYHPRAVEADSVGWDKGVPPIPITTFDPAVMLVPVPTDKSSQLKLREPKVLEALIEQWKQSYSLVILDCAAVNLNNQFNLPAAQVLKAADGVMMCYLAGHTAAVKLKQACAEIQSQNAMLLGVVLNDRYNPSLKSELLRCLPKMLTWAPWLSRWLCGKITISQLLSIKI